MNILRRRFFCAGFRFLPHKRASVLFLRRWHGVVLRLLRVRPCAHVLRAQARRFLGWRCIRYRWTLGQWLPDRCLSGIFCHLLNKSTSSLFLRCGRWYALRRVCFRTGAKSVCALARLARHVFRCRHSWGRTFLRRFWRDRRCCRCLCSLLNVRTSSLFLRCGRWCALQRA